MAEWYLWPGAHQEPSQATTPVKPEPGNEAFSQVAAILLLNEDAKVINGILKMGRQHTHGINLEDIPHVPRH